MQDWIKQMENENPNFKYEKHYIDLTDEELRIVVGLQRNLIYKLVESIGEMSDTTAQMNDTIVRLSNIVQEFEQAQKLTHEKLKTHSDVLHHLMDKNSNG